MRGVFGLRLRRSLGTWIGSTLALCPTIGVAADAQYSPEVPQVWLNPGFLSYHADRSKHFREDNFGFGAEVIFARDHGFFAGSYINSDRSRSHYAMYQWRPLHWRPEGIDVSAGLGIGGVNGYRTYRDGGWGFGALPMFFFEGKRLGTNLVIVPGREADKRLVAIQLKVRVW